MILHYLNYHIKVCRHNIPNILFQTITLYTISLPHNICTIYFANNNMSPICISISNTTYLPNGTFCTVLMYHMQQCIAKYIIPYMQDIPNTYSNHMHSICTIDRVCIANSVFYISYTTHIPFFLLYHFILPYYCRCTQFDAFSKKIH